MMLQYKNFHLLLSHNICLSLNEKIVLEGSRNGMSAMIWQSRNGAILRAGRQSHQHFGSKKQT